MIPSVKKQLDEWVKGNSTHNPERNECCPDFSCCAPNLKWDDSTRERFARACYEDDQITKGNMLGMSLGQLASSINKEAVVYIAGEDNDQTACH